MDVDRERLMQIARAEIGQDEKPHGSNWGGKIPEYLASVAIHSPAPWCAAFVYWVYRQLLGDKNPLPKTGYTPLIYNWAEKNESIIEPKEAQKGDLILFYFPSMGRVAHIGLVGQVKPSGVWTIEGNTNDDGGREGYEVARRYRSLSSRMFFVNPFMEKAKPGASRRNVGARSKAVNRRRPRAPRRPGN